MQFDYLAILNMVLVIHDQNPKLTNKELQENLIKVSYFLALPVLLPVLGH